MPWDVRVFNTQNITNVKADGLESLPPETGQAPQHTHTHTAPVPAHLVLGLHLVGFPPAPLQWPIYYNGLGLRPGLDGRPEPGAHGTGALHLTLPWHGPHPQEGFLGPPVALAWNLGCWPRSPRTQGDQGPKDTQPVLHQGPERSSPADLGREGRDPAVDQAQPRPGACPEASSPPPPPGLSFLICIVGGASP